MKKAAVNKIRDLFDDLRKDRKSLIKILSVLVILLLAGILRIHGASRSDVSIESAGASETAESADAAADNADAEGISADDIFVDIGGQVEKPGVYQISYGTRLYQLIELAGGLTDDADTDAINRASYVEDGEKIIIPARSSSEASSSSDQGSASTGVSADGLVNINYADKETLKTLNGIGDVIAERIIEYRQANRFKKIEDIKSVKGIGDGIFEKIKDDITC